MVKTSEHDNLWFTFIFIVDEPMTEPSCSVDGATVILEEASKSFIIG